MILRLGLRFQYLSQTDSPNPLVSDISSQIIDASLGSLSTQKLPRHFFHQKPLKTVIWLRWTINTKTKLSFWEYDHRILYYICMRLCAKFFVFVMFDCTDWKILTFKVKEFFFVESYPRISDDFDHNLWMFFALWVLNLKFQNIEIHVKHISNNF